MPRSSISVWIRRRGVPPCPFALSPGSVVRWPRTHRPGRPGSARTEMRSCVTRRILVTGDPPRRASASTGPTRGCQAPSARGARLRPRANMTAQPGSARRGCLTARPSWSSPTAPPLAAIPRQVVELVEAGFNERWDLLHVALARLASSTRAAHGGTHSLDGAARLGAAADALVRRSCGESDRRSSSRLARHVGDRPHAAPTGRPGAGRARASAACHPPRAAP